MTTAQGLMDNASKMMAVAQQLEEQANTKITELENLLNSKQLNDKISELEKSATTSKLEKQVQATVNLQHAQTLIEDAKRIYDAYFHDLNDDVRTETRAATFKYHQLKHPMSQLSFEVHAIGDYNGLVNETKVLEETRGILKKALDLNQHANTLYDQIQQRRKEKGE